MGSTEGSNTHGIVHRRAQSEAINSLALALPE